MRTDRRRGFAERVLTGILWLAILCAPAAVTWAISGPADSDPRAEVERRARTAGLNDAQISRVRAALSDAQAKDLPVEPLCDRYLQGFAKGVAVPRIEAAVAQLEERLEQAASCVDAVFLPPSDAAARGARSKLVALGADALGSGATTDALSRTMRVVLPEKGGLAEAGPPVLAFGLMVLGGLTPDRSLDVVQVAWSRGYRGPDLQKLGQDLAALGPAGKGPPDKLVDQVISMLRSEEPRDRVLRALEGMHGPGSPGYLPPGTGPGDDPTHGHHEDGPRPRDRGGPPGGEHHGGPGGHGR